MEWLAVATWGLAALIGLILARGALGTPSLGLQALAGAGGLALSILFIVLDGEPGFAWAAFGLGVVGLLAAAAGAMALMSDDHLVTSIGQEGEETEALLEGIEWELFALAAVFTLLMATGVATLA